MYGGYAPQGARQGVDFVFRSAAPISFQCSTYWFEQCINCAVIALSMAYSGEDYPPDCAFQD